MIRRLSKSIWALFIALLLLLAGLAYLAMTAIADQVVPRVIQHTAELRAESSAGLFKQAEASVLRLQAVLIRRLDNSNHDAAMARFNLLFAQSSDGLWRLRPQFVDPEHAPTLYLHQPPRGLTDSAKLRAVVSYDLLREQGPALDPPFFSVYMDFVEDGLMVYSRGMDWASAADADYTNTGYPTMQGSEPRNNPLRKLFWTPVYLDKQANTWMVSVIKPLDWNRQWVGTVGHDVSVQSLIDSVNDTDRSNGFRLILSAGGDLIAHPDLRKRIADADGQLKITALNDPLLEQIYQLLLEAKTPSGAGRTADGRHWVAWSRIAGPEWYQIYVFPQARVNRFLAMGLLGFLIFGLACMLPAIWLLRERVHQIIAIPLQRLTDAVDTLSQGKAPKPIVIDKDDELGQLASAFNLMVEDLGNQHALQRAHAQALESEIHERRQVTTHLEEEKARLLALLGAMNVGILFVNADQRTTYANNAFMQLWRFPAGVSLVGRTLEDIYREPSALMGNPGDFLAHIRRIQDSPNSSSQCEIRMQCGRMVMLYTHPVCDQQKRPLGWLWVNEDVTRERQVAAQLTHLAERDALTGLYNRRRFEDELTQFFKNNESKRTPASLLFFDLDEFKYINDTFGHRAGDAVLSHMATEVQTLVPDTATLFRLGGDEFALFMPGSTLDAAEQLAERIVHRVAQTPLSLPEPSLRMTTSLGIACFPTHATNVEDLSAHADTAMYQAKRSGKNRFSVYRQDRDTAQEMVTRMAWNERINRAFENGLFRLHFQGIYHAHNGHLAHLEALIRLQDETRPGELILPGQFIPFAEKNGRILDIDRWVIRESIGVLARHPHLHAIAINISGRSFDDPDLPAYITNQLLAQHVSPKRLLVELTETSALSDMSDASRFIDSLRRTGCTICLDDFGTGFSSFAYLKQIKADVLKIDGMFIRNLTYERDNQLFVRAIIDVARGLGKQTVAEFVEDAKTMLMLREMGVDMLQGYHLDRPRDNHPALDPPAFDSVPPDLPQLP